MLEITNHARPSRDALLAAYRDLRADAAHHVRCLVARATGHLIPAEGPACEDFAAIRARLGWERRAGNVYALPATAPGYCAEVSAAVERLATADRYAHGNNPSYALHLLHGLARITARAVAALDRARVDHTPPPGIAETGDRGLSPTGSVLTGLLEQAARLVDDGLPVDAGLLEVGAEHLGEIFGLPAQMVPAVVRIAAYRIARAAGHHPDDLDDPVVDQMLAELPTWPLPRQARLLRHAARA